MRPSIFIGSSSETLDVAYAIQANLDRDAEPTVWDQGVFELSKSTLASLLDALASYDFAVFVLGPDDIAKIRMVEYRVARDNVIFELGLFIGALGAPRTFFVLPRDRPDLHLPTDLAGITGATFDARRRDGNMRAALGPACQEIRKTVAKLGSRTAPAPVPSPAPSSTRKATKPKPKPAPLAKFLDPREEVVVQLRDFIQAADSIRAQVTKNSLPIPDADEQLIRWKMKVCRYLDRSLGHSEAKSFLQLHTSLGAATEMEHFSSAFKKHLSALEVLAGEIEDDPAYPVLKSPSPSGKLSLGNVSFTYRASH